MKKLLIFLLLAACLVAETADGILEKSRDRLSLPGSEAVMTLRITSSNGRQRVRKIAMASKLFDEDLEKRIIRFVEPSTVAGMGMLIEDYKTEDDNMWIYLPVKGSARRMKSSEKSSSFMGSEFTNGDMSGLDPNEFNSTIIGYEKIGNYICAVIESVPSTEELAGNMGWSRKRTWMDTTRFVPLKAHFFNTGNELKKEMTVLDIKLMDDKQKLYSLTGMRIKNIQSGRSSTLTMDRIELNPDVNSDYFTVGYLSK